MANEQLSRCHRWIMTKRIVPSFVRCLRQGNAVVSDRTPGDNFPALMAATEQLVPLVEEDAKEAEQLFRQTDRVVAALRKVRYLFDVAPP